MVKSKVYKVGGAVRDLLLGKKPHDNDYVVVGSTPQEMKQKGFYEVGKGFPVFLHPQTHEEYALARKEIKTGAKHTDFKFIFDENITLQEDLARRDFTCNAIAYDMEKGQIIDYFGGVEDIKKKVLKHVNAIHFVEDPLRILRMCRFGAQLEFEPAAETLKLCRQMVTQGMLDYLTPERVWQEIWKALQCSEFFRFVEIAFEVGALQAIFPQVGAFVQATDDEKSHLEKDFLACTVLALKAAKQSSDMVKFAVLLHNVCKINKIKAEKGLQATELIKQICSHLKVPVKFCNFAVLTEKNLELFDRVLSLNVGELLDFAESLRIGRICCVNAFIDVCRAVQKSLNESLEQSEDFDKKAQLLCRVCDMAAKIKAQDMPDFEIQPKDSRFKDILRQYKIKVIQESLQSDFIR